MQIPGGARGEWLWMKLIPALLPVRCGEKIIEYTETTKLLGMLVEFYFSRGLFSSAVLILSLYRRNQNTLICFSCFAEDLFKLISSKFRMVCKVDGNLQLDSRDWSMYSSSLDVRL